MGGILRRLTNNRVHDTGLPHGRLTANELSSSSDKKGNHGNHEIYVMDNDGGNQQKLTNNPRHT